MGYTINPYIGKFDNAGVRYSKLYTTTYPTVNTQALGTTEYSTSYEAFDCFRVHTAAQLIGSSSGVSWLSANGSKTNQCLHLDLQAAQIVTKILYHNYHSSGESTTRGAKTVTIWGSNSAAAFADTSYANDTDWTQLTASASTFDQHVGTNTADPKNITLTNTTAYQYIRFKFADNWGDASYMGVRMIECQYISDPTDKIPLFSDSKGNIITDSEYGFSDLVKYTRITSTSTPSGAEIVGIYDGLDLFASTNVEDALAELALTFPSYVPYTGATGDVDLGLFDLTTTDLTVNGVFNQLDKGTAEGQLAYWDNTQGKWVATDSAYTYYTNSNKYLFHKGSLFIGNDAVTTSLTPFLVRHSDSTSVVPAAFSIQLTSTRASGPQLSNANAGTFIAMWSPTSLSLNRTTQQLNGINSNVNTLVPAGEDNNMTVNNTSCFIANANFSDSGTSTGVYTIVNHSSFRAANPLKSTVWTITNNVAFYDPGQTSATNNWGLGINTQSYINANLSIGKATAPTQALDVVGSGLLSVGLITPKWTSTTEAFEFAGDTADTDLTFNFTGTTNSGQFLWMEDEDYFQFNDGILLNSTEQTFYRDTAIGIYSQADSYLDLFADGAVRIGNSSAGAPTTYMAVEPDGDTFWVGDGSGLPYGSFYGNEINWSSGALTAPQYAQIADTDCVQGEVNEVTYTDAGTTLTVLKAGRYLINYSISAESSVANTHLLAGITINSTTVLQNAGRSHVEPGSAGAQYAMGGTAILDLAANDVVGVGIGSDVDNITVTVDHVNLTLTMVGGT